jgi:hypothetical protein
MGNLLIKMPQQLCRTAASCQVPNFRHIPPLTITPMNRILVFGALCALALYLLDGTGTVQISGGSSGAGSSAAGYFGAPAKVMSGVGG